MDISNYYYKLLDLETNASKQDIVKSYNAKIKKYTGLPYLDVNQESEVKELKRAYAVLTIEELREIYDSYNSSKQKESEKMIDHEKKFSRKEKLDSQSLSNRVFQMVGLANVPQKNFDIDRTFFSSNSFGDEGRLKSANEDDGNFQTL